MRLKARRPSAGDRLVVLVDVVQRRLEHELRRPVVPDLDQQLEDLLTVIRERAHVEVVHREVRLRDAELGRRLSHLAGERVRGEAFGERPRRDREGDVADVRPGLDEAGHRAAAAELAVVGVRGQDERPRRRADHAGHRGTVGCRPEKCLSGRPDVIRIFASTLIADTALVPAGAASLARPGGGP